MTQQPSLTVIIPTHNRRELLMRTVRSVTSQVGVHMAVIVVDDGGMDKSCEAVTQLGLTNLCAIRHDIPLGVSAARNTGLALVETEWCAFVDDDDLWAPEKAHLQLRALQSATPSGWSCVGAVHFNERAEILGYAHAPESRVIVEELSQYNAVPGGGSGVLVRTSLARDVGGFDQSLSLLADWDFYLRLSLIAPPCSLDLPLMGYFRHSDSMINNPRAYLRELLFMEEKYREHKRVDGSPVLLIEWQSTIPTIALMARRLGDRRASIAVLLRGMSHAGLIPIVAGMLARIRLKFRQVTSRGWDRGTDNLDVDWLIKLFADR